MRRVQSDAGNSPLRSFRLVVFPVAHHRVIDRRKLHSNLILQSRHQLNSDQRCAHQGAFDGISKFGASRFRIALDTQFLEHSFPSKVMDQLPFPGDEPSTNHRQILSHGSMGEKLSNESIPIRLGFRK